MAEDKEKVSTKITVSGSCKTSTEVNPKISIEKDAALSQTICFDYEKPYFFRVYHNASIVNVFATAGQTNKEGYGYEEIEEIVAFSCSDTISTSKPLYSLLSSQWLGNSLGSVSVLDNGDLKISSPGYGVLKVKYKSYYEIYSLRTIVKGEVVIVATTGSEDCESGAASATHTVEMGCDEEGYKNIRFIVADYTTGNPLPFATVIFLGQNYTTDQFGKTDIIINVPLGNYDVVTIKSGYILSNQDELNNDKITVN